MSTTVKPKAWTAKEISVLKNSRTKSNAELAKQLGRTTNSVGKKRRALKLQQTGAKKPVAKKAPKKSIATKVGARKSAPKKVSAKKPAKATAWTKAQENYILKNLDKPLAEVSKTLGRTPVSVASKRKRLVAASKGASSAKKATVKKSAPKKSTAKKTTAKKTFTKKDPKKVQSASQDKKIHALETRIKGLEAKFSALGTHFDRASATAKRK